MADDARIADLERRVSSDPASIAFAQLAEEYRRAGRLEDAVRLCQAGLEQHPAYPSARVTLGRALLALGRHDEALTQFEAAATTDPDNIAAKRALEEWRRVCGPLPSVAQVDPALQDLEGWLEALRADRVRRGTAIPTKDPAAE